MGSGTFVERTLKADVSVKVWNVSAPQNVFTYQLFGFLARIHSLSPYTPICRQCGLILCLINTPFYACPHCETSLLTSDSRETLISRVENEISETLSQEEQERQRAAEEARQTAGAFPTLSGAPPRPSDQLLGGSLQSHPVNQPHKVLSLNTKTKRVVVSSYRTRPQSNISVAKNVGVEEPAEQPVLRVPPPPPEVPIFSKGYSPDRPWARLDGESALYTQDPQANKTSVKSRSRKKQNPKDTGQPSGAGKENSNETA